MKGQQRGAVSSPLSWPSSRAAFSPFVYGCLVGVPARQVRGPRANTGAALAFTPLSSGTHTGCSFSGPLSLGWGGQKGEGNPGFSRDRDGGQVLRPLQLCLAAPHLLRPHRGRLVFPLGGPPARRGCLALLSPALPAWVLFLSQAGLGFERPQSRGLTFTVTRGVGQNAGRRPRGGV